MSSDLMDHLREECCDVFGDLAPERLGGASPDAFGSDKHAITPLSSAKVNQLRHCLGGELAQPSVR